MLRNTKDLHGYAIHATDGDIGHVDEFYFDDESWIIRYLVVNTGTWLVPALARLRVLISNDSIGETNWDERKIFVKLTREQVENAPGVETDRPVTRQWEAGYLDYYDIPYYWGSAGVYGMGDAYPGFLTTPKASGRGRCGATAGRLALAEYSRRNRLPHRGHRRRDRPYRGLHH